MKYFTFFLFLELCDDDRMMMIVRTVQNFAENWAIHEIFHILLSLFSFSAHRSFSLSFAHAIVGLDLIRRLVPLLLNALTRLGELRGSGGCELSNRRCLMRRKTKFFCASFLIMFSSKSKRERETLSRLKIGCGKLYKHILEENRDSGLINLLSKCERCSPLSLTPTRLSDRAWRTRGSGRDGYHGRISQLAHTMVRAPSISSSHTRFISWLRLHKMWWLSNSRTVKKTYNFSRYTEIFFFIIDKCLQACIRLEFNFRSHYNTISWLLHVNKHVLTFEMLIFCVLNFIFTISSIAFRTRRLWLTAQFHSLGAQWKAPLAAPSNMWSEQRKFEIWAKRDFAILQV